MKVLAKAFTIKDVDGKHNVLALRYFPERYSEVQACKESMHTPCPGDKHTFFHDLDTNQFTEDVFKLPYSLALRHINEHWDALKSGDTIERETWMLHR